MIKFIRGLAALLVVLGVVIGGPIALVRFGRLDAFAQIDWGRLFSTPDDGSLVLGIVTLIGWVAWGLATASLASEAIAALTSQRIRLRLPGIGVFAPASAVLITAIIGLVSGQVLAPAPAQAAELAERPGPVVAMLAAQAPAEDVAPNAPQAGVSHTVVPGDDLWSLAEHYYGDGSRWREILVANDTVLLDATAVLQPGMLLHIPDPAPRPAAETQVVVEAGDTLSSLAAEHLGDAERWPELAAANPDRIGDPDAIDVGWQLRLPGGATQVVASEPAVAEPETANQAEAEAPEDSLPQTPPPEIAPTPELERCEAPVGPVANAEQHDQATFTATAAWAATLPASLGAVLCTGLAGAYAWRRRQQQALRPLGKRLPPLPDEIAPVGSALASVVDDDPLHAVALRRVGLGHVGDAIVHRDLASASTVSLSGADGEEISLATALALSLASVPDDEPLTVVVAGPPFAWLASLDDPRLQVHGSLAGGQAHLDALIADRTAGRPAGAELAQLRSNPELAEAWTPTVVLLAGAPSDPLPGGLAELGVTVISCGPEVPAQLRIRVADGQAVDLDSGEVFVPYLVDLPARRALDELFATAATDDYPPAPWWDAEGAETPTALGSIALLPLVKDLPVTAPVESEHPVINLLGPVALVGARGQEPNRAIKQCEEYCAWLLEYPGSSALAMGTALMVAETTRRSNMSRLRSWLGETPEGEPYLPDAYTGRISLHPGVSSDWEQFRMYVHGGVNRAGDEALLAALSLVRGAPLADAAPGQWHWAEQLRADMCAAIRDAGVVLAGRALDGGDPALASWAISRVEAVAPDDHLLAVNKIRLAQLAGDTAEVDRLVLQLTRSARALGVDLADDVVVLLQEAVEGRARLRRA